MKQSICVAGRPKSAEEIGGRLGVKSEDLEVVYYPYYVAPVTVGANGVLRGSFAVWIDLCRGGEAMSEAAVETCEVEADMAVILPVALAREDAVARARAFAIHAAIAQGKWLTAPKVEVENGRVVYRLFYVSNQRLLVDGVTCETAPL